MTAETTQRCPTRHELAEVLSGRNLDRLEAVTNHLENCDSCAESADSLQRENPLEQTIRANPPTSGPQLPEITSLIKRVQQMIGKSSRETGNYQNLSTADDGSASQSEVRRRTFDRDALSVLMPSNDPDLLGELGPYRIRELIGHGGMGVVFLAEDSRLQRQVALKVLLPSKVTDAQQRERFLREARAAAGIKHGNVVRVYQVDAVEGPLGITPYLAMELLEGETLDQHLANGRTFTYEEIKCIGAQIAAGLSAAHAGGLIHRDIKPANIFLERPSEGPQRDPGSTASSIVRHQVAGTLHNLNVDPTVKLLDFGLALPMESVDGRLTQDGYLIGTPAWMSPEQASCMPLDPRSDLFSLGSVMYQLATGELPFKGATTTLQLAAVLNHIPTPILTLNPALPIPLANVIMQLLEKPLSARPASAADVHDRLRAMNLTASSTSVQRAFIILRSREHRARLVVGLVALLACCVWFQQNSASSITLPLRTAAPSTLALTNPDAVQNDEHTSIELMPYVSPTLTAGWYQRVTQLPCIPRTNEVEKEFKRLNPRFDNTLRFGIFADRVRDLTIDSDHIEDISPLAALRELQVLHVLNSRKAIPNELRDLRPLRGLKLKELLIEHCPLIEDFDPLDAMPLTRASFYGSSLPNAAWFSRNKLIETLNLGGRSIAADLNMLRTLPLVGLELNHSPVEDLTPISHHRLEMLTLAATKVSDLAPIQGMPLVRIDIRSTPITKLEPLRHLRYLEFRLYSGMCG